MIENIKLGIKIATKNFDFIPEINVNKDLIDFIEIILMPEFNSDDINSINELKFPYVIHIPSSNYGIDFGDKEKNKNNEAYIQKLNQICGKLTPICYIVHPESGDMNLSIKNLKKIKAKPLALENMPKKSLKNGDLLGYDINQLKEYFKQIPNLEFCFDLNHAIKAAISMNLKSFDYMQQLIDYKKPIIFHLSGGNLNVEADEHLPLNEGQYDLRLIKNFLLSLDYELYLTFETPRNYEKKSEDDIKNMKLFINL